MKLTKESIQTLVEMSDSRDYRLFHSGILVAWFEKRTFGCCLVEDGGSKFKYEYEEDAPISVFKRVELENTNGPV